MLGRTMSGGLSAALCVIAARRLSDELPPLRSAQFSFVGPASGAITATAELIRRGKSSVVAGVSLDSAQGPGVRALLSFGMQRSSALLHNNLSFPSVMAPQKCPEFLAPQTPFHRQYEFRLAAGAQPFTGATVPEYLIWVRHSDPHCDADEPSLIALADAAPPPATLMFAHAAPIATVTWSLDLLGRPRSAPWRLLRSNAQFVAEGHCSHETTLWDDRGTPLMASRQTTAMFY